MSASYVGEAYSFLRRHKRQDIAEDWRESSGTLPVTIEVPTLAGIWNAASLKGSHTRTHSQRRYPKNTTVLWSLAVLNSDPSIS
jgi:hypothetical protein